MMHIIKASAKKQSIVIVNSICCWKTRRLLVGLATKLTRDGYQTLTVTGNAGVCSLMASPLLPDPKEDNCRLRIAELQEELVSANEDVVLFKSYIVDKMLGVADKTLEIYRNVRLDALIFEDVDVWDLIKGSVAKDQKADDVSKLGGAEIRNLPKGVRRYAHAAIVMLQALPILLMQIRCSKLLVFNGFFWLERTAVEVAKRMRLQSIAFERSLFRGYYYFSANGMVGNRLPIAQAPLAEVARSRMTVEEMSDLKNHFAALGHYVQQGRGSSKVHISGKGLFIAQVPFDTVVVYDNPRFASILDAIMATLLAAEDIGLEVVIKLHPCERELTGFRTKVSLIEQYPKADIIADECTLQEALRQCQFAITVNSQGGIEALMQGKSLIVLGRAFYQGKGLTMDWDASKDLRQFLNAARSGYGIPNEKLVWKFMRRLRDDHLVRVTDDEQDVSLEGYAHIRRILGEC